MFSYIKKALSVPTNPQQDDLRDIIRYEAKLGGQLFGPTPPKHRREFFCLDEHTWVWHEEWSDDTNHHQMVTTRYDVRTNGIFKTQGHRPYTRLSQQELENFHEAVQLYGQKVGGELVKLVNQS